MSEQRRCAGCENLIPDDAETIAVQHVVIAVGEARNIEMGINYTEQNIVSPDTFLCLNPYCGGSWFRNELKKLRKEALEKIPR